MRIGIIFILTFTFALSLKAQTSLKELLNSADTLFESGGYFDAVTEYKRLQFFDSENRFAFKTNFSIGKSYKAGLKLDEAILYFGKALTFAPDKKSVFELTTQIIRCNILRGTLSNAFSLIASAGKEFKRGKYSDELNYWLGWTYMFDKKWDKASLIFKKSGNEELAELCGNVINEEFPVTITKLISYIVPGAGQFYTGNYLSGFMSLGWNILWGYVTVNAFMAERVFDGVITADLLWFRFYRGNYQNAEKFAVEKNVEIYNNAYGYLMKNYKGKKP
jgi:tetratricopeptide (TPR) repeat protein